MSFTCFSLNNSIITLKQLDQEERRINLKIIDELYEIEKRKAYSDLKYESLYVFCIKELNFTEYQTHTRIQAMRAIKATPELKEKIEMGKINVSTVAQVQSYIRLEQVQTQTKKTKEEKLELFTQFENKTSRQVKEQISLLKGERIKKKLVIELDEEAETLWVQTKARLAHSTQGDELNCLKHLMKNILKEEKVQRTVSGTEKHTRYITKPIKIEIKEKANYQCQNCGSKYALQIEHKKPFAHKGTRNSENLELLCRNCNINRGIKSFGLEKMKRI